MADGIDFDVFVIGAGPGGYECAIRAAQLGFKTAAADPWKDADGKAAPGGTCTNVGCIPSKAMLASSLAYESAGETFRELGINVGPASFDLDVIQARRAKVVRKSNDGILWLFKKNGVEFFPESAHFLPGGKPGAWKIGLSDGTEITAANVVVAAGSVPRLLPGVTPDEKTILTSTGGLEQTSVPKRLGIIGAGVIGLEIGAVWQRLGAEVTMLEALPGFLGIADEEISRAALQVYKKTGFTFHFGCRVESVEKRADGVVVRYRTGDEEKEAVFDRLMVSIGRVPALQSVNPEAVGLKADARGFVEVDEGCRTNLPGVYAIRDLVRGPMLAHKASDEGVAVAEEIAGEHPVINHRLVPSVIYTHPEIAWVGLTEAEARNEGYTAKAGKAFFSANGRARAQGQTDGFVKIVADAENDRVLGIHILGSEAGELIAAASFILATEATCEDVALTTIAHPTFAEAIREAALTVLGRPMNS